MNTDKNIDSIVICECSSSEHMIRFCHFADDDDYAYLQVHLRPDFSIWKRIRTAVRYILGYRSKYGDFDEFLIGSKNIDILLESLNKARKRMLTSRPAIEINHD